jgi:hypothetical protein
MKADANQHHAAWYKTRRTTVAGAVDFQSPAAQPAYANSTQSCRPRKALLSSGQLCLKSGTPFEHSELLGFSG